MEMDVYQSGMLSSLFVFLLVLNFVLTRDLLETV